MMYRIIVLAIFLMYDWSVYAHDSAVRIGLFYDVPVSSLVISFPTGGYVVYGGLADSLVISGGGTLYATLFDQKIWVRNKTTLLGTYQQIRIMSLVDTSYVRLRTVDPMGKMAEYQGHIYIDSWQGYLRIVNELDEDRYVASVAEAEGGSGAPLEFLKTQCIISRTFYYRHGNQHIAEGFFVCDGTHCQAYKGKNTNARVLTEAARETDGLVIFDQHGTLIEAAFHSNSGGEIQGSESLWLHGMPYLSSRKDPWSEGGPNYRWESRISLLEWTNYLQNSGFDISRNNLNALIFKQPSRRSFYVVGSDSVSFRQIREDFGLRSSFFDVEIENGMVVLRGRGYGHGIGLSQEGGIEMAKRGFWFTDIIQYYYPGVTIERFLSR